MSFGHRSFSSRFQRFLLATSVMEKKSVMKEVFSYSSLVHAVSGAVGSVVGITVFFPLDTARTRLQVDDGRKSKHTPMVLAEILKEEGILAWYRGWLPVITSLCCSNFVYFYTYNSLKIVLLGKMQKTDPLKDLSFAFIAGVINVLVTTPLWVVNTRLKLQGVKFHSEKMKEAKMQKYKGIIDCFVKIIRNESVGVLWNGTMPSIWLASNPAIQFMIYEACKRFFQQRFSTKELSGILYFIIGAIAKTGATFATYPLQVIQSKLRAGFSKNLEMKSSNIISCLKQIFAEGGLQGLYKGLEAKLVQTVLTAALMFVVYEKIAAFTFRMMGQDPAVMISR